MLSNRIEIWMADGHYVIEKATGEYLNAKHEYVIIKKHSWIARGVKLLKRAKSLQIQWSGPAVSFPDRLRSNTSF